MAESPGQGDFDTFYAATITRVVRYMYIVLGSAAEAEDAAHEAYVRAWQRWSTVSRYDDPEAWVRMVAYRAAVSSWRKAKNRISAQRNGFVDDVPELSPDRLAIAAALRQLPVEQRQALVLHHMYGMTVAEIAQETGAPTGTVKARLARGRKALAPYVSEFADDEGLPRTPPPQTPPPRAASLSQVMTAKKGARSDA
nr:sigma-70 family RNA polymerase sigma factor [Catenulispora pinisilvae]